MALLAINMIATVDGRATLNGTATGIGSRHDRARMLELRASMDVVLHGAGTVRADPVTPRVPTRLAALRVARGQSAQPLGAIITGRGQLPAQHPYYDSPTRIYKVGGGQVSVSKPSIEVMHVPDVAAAVRDLTERGARRILCEGGARLNAELFAAELVDEVYFTLAPKVFGGDLPLTIVQGVGFPPAPLELLGVDRVDDELFVHYRVKH